MKNFSRRSFLGKMSVAALSAGPLAHHPLWASATQNLVFVGVYTDNKGSTSKGIYAFHWDADAGALTPLGLAAPTSNPSFLALAPDRKHLYAVNETENYQGKQSGSVSSFAVLGNSGKLKQINVVPSMGTSPCNIAVDFTGKAVFTANYSSGSAASFKVTQHGGLTRAVSDFQYSGHSVNERQAGPHAHCTTVSPDNKWVLVNDLGLDRISVYHLDPATAKLTPNDPPYYEALPGSGPRNFVFHPSGRWAYSLNEINSTVDTLSWDSERGMLARLQNLSTLPDGFSGSNTAATVTVDAAGRFVYTSNRGHDSVAVFAVSDHDGTLTPVQHVPCGGKTPRHFVLDPGNQWLLTANQDSSNIVVFARNSHTGQLTPTGREYAVSVPVCVLFA